MEIKIVSPEIIGKDDYQPTAMENVFVNTTANSICIIGDNEAIVLKLNKLAN